MSEDRANAIGSAFGCATAGFAVIALLASFGGFLNEATKPVVGALAGVWLSLSIIGALIAAFFGSGVMASHPFNAKRHLVATVSAVGLSLALGATGFLTALALFVTVADGLVAIGVGAIGVGWLIVRWARRDADYGARMRLGNAEVESHVGRREQRLSAYLAFLIPAVSVSLLLLSSDQMAPFFAGVGFVSALTGAAMERYLSQAFWIGAPKDAGTQLS